MTASPGQLIVMLYDGARRFLHQAATAMGEHDIPGAHNKLTRAEDIIRHLLDALDMDQGEISERLESIYLFCLRYLQQARFDRDANKLEKVGNLLGELREAWATIAGQ